MRTIKLILFLVMVVWGGGLRAQTPAPEAPIKCRMTLPYEADPSPDCTSRSAAAYDFAFCSVSFFIVALSAPESDKALGEKSRSAGYRKRSNDYAMVSAALSDPATLQNNVALAQKYYDSLNGKDGLYVRLAIDYINQKCDGVEAYHSDAIEEVGRAGQRKPAAVR